MSNNGINYPMYNNFPYSPIMQQQTFYGQQYSNPAIPQYGSYPMYPPIQNQPQYNSYDHLIQSAAETLAAFTHPSELGNLSNLQSRLTQPSSNRRPIPKPSTSTNSTKMFYCETCRIACGGQTSYQAHLNGIKHKKKEMNNNNNNNTTTTNNTQNQQTNQNTYRCELCDIICTSSDAYQAHLDGSKHQKAVKLHKKLGKTIPETNNESQIVTKNGQDQNKFIGIEYIETTYDQSNIPKSYHCKLCDCKFNDANGRDAHLKGKRHRLSYKKKVNPNFQVDTNNKVPSPKQRIENPPEQPANNDYSNQIEIDDDTRYLMNLHQQIIPSQNLLDTVEEFIGAVETSLKSCSDQLQPSESSTTDTITSTTNDTCSLMGVSRLGALVKNLMLNSDRLFELVVICTSWPTKELLEKIYLFLLENFHSTWKKPFKLQYETTQEFIRIPTDTDHGQIIISISLTSLLITQTNQISEQYLSKINCLNALYAMNSVRWFQNQVSKRQFALPLIRCLRYKTTISSKWKSLSSETIEILIEQILPQSPSPIKAFRRVLEYLAGGLVLSNGPGLRISWQNDLNKDIFENLTNQERNDITYEAQIGLRLLVFGKLNQWFEQCDIPQVQKRSYSNDDDNNSISTKRQCIESDA